MKNQNQIREGIAEYYSASAKVKGPTATARRAWVRAGCPGGLAAFAADYARARRAKAAARRVGLAYWPALLGGSRIDPAAFVAAEAVLARLAGGCWVSQTAQRGGWDAEGHHGLNVRHVETAWLLAGAKDGPKFRAIIAAAYRLGEMKRKALGASAREVLLRLVRRSSSLRDVTAIFRALRWAFRPGRCWSGARLDHNAAVALGRLSPACRWAALSGVAETGTLLRLRDLNWEAVKVAQQRGPRAAARFMPAGVASGAAWQRFAPEWATEARAAALLNPEVAGVPAGPFRHWMAAALAQGTDVGNALRPALALARLFGRDVAAAARFIGRRSIHDAGQVNLPEERFSSGWGAWLVAHPSGWARVNLLAAIEKELGGRLPASAAEFRAVADTVAKRDPSAWLLALGVTPAGVRDYLHLFAAPGKAWEAVPGVQVEQGEYSLCRLEAGDPEGVAVGLLTDCCQHLHGAAAACARAVWTRADAAVWALRKKGSIVAQAFCWVSNEGDLVLDSVEALGGQDTEVLARLFQAGAEQVLGKQVLGKLSVRRVLVGNTHYGASQAIAPAGARVSTPRPMFGDFGYTDAQNGCRVVAEDAEAGIPDAFVAAVVKVEATPEAVPVNALLEGSGVYCEHCESEVHPLCEVCPACGQDISEWVDEAGDDEEDGEDE